MHCRLMKITALIFASLLLLAVANAQDAKTDQKAQKTDVKAGEKSPTKSAEKAIKKTLKSETSKVVLPKDVKKLIVEDTIVGNGKPSAKGKKIKVHYTGWLYDPTKAMGRGKQFDSSQGKDPFQFVLGGGEVIKGWDEGFDNMKVGGKRKLIIPSEMGYGERGAGAEIPPNSPLMFEVELLDVL